ncbi:MAG: helix-turn-helix domain-containing protein [Eubacteriaceae bacterium]
MKTTIINSDETLNIPAIQDVLTSFFYSTEVPVTLYDENTISLWSAFPEKKICGYFKQPNADSSLCQNALHFASTWAQRLGEPYIFVCPSGFVNIAIAILNGHQFAGSIIAGPIAMGNIEESTIRDMFTIHQASPEVLYNTTLFIRNMKIFSPTQVGHIAKTLNSAIMSLYPNTEVYEKLNQEYHEQAEIGEQIFEHKRENIPLVYPYEKEQELVRQVKEGDHIGAQITLKFLVNEILLIEGGNIEVIKARILELCTILSRAAVEGGASLQKIFGINLDLITELNKIDSIQILSSWTAKITDHFTKNIFSNIYNGDSYLINQAIEHTRTNYMNKITLQKMSDYLHVSDSYLSKLFKEETGISFTQYLNEIRINRSKDLLQNTKMTIVDIALYVGYEDQSYFTKVFKKITGVTPKKYQSRKIY